MQAQTLVLMAHHRQSGAAQLPVGVVVRDADTGVWESEMVGGPDDGGWMERLSVVGDVLATETLDRWQRDANGVTWDVMTLVAEGDSLTAILADHMDDALRNWVLLREEC